MFEDPVIKKNQYPATLDPNIVIIFKYKNILFIIIKHNINYIWTYFLKKKNHFETKVWIIRKKQFDRGRLYVYNNSQNMWRMNREQISPNSQYYFISDIYLLKYCFFVGKSYK